MSSPLCNPKFLEHLKQSKAKTKLRMHLKADRIIDRVYSQVLADLHLFFAFDHEVVTPREVQSGGEPPVLSQCTILQRQNQSLNFTPLDVNPVPNVSQNGDPQFDAFQTSIAQSLFPTTNQSPSLSEPINSYPTHQITQHDNDMDNSSTRDDIDEPEVKQESDEAITELSNSFVQSNKVTNEGLSNEPMPTGLAHCLPSLSQPNGHVQSDSISYQQFQGSMIKQEIDGPPNFQLESQQNDHSMNSSSSYESSLFPQSMMPSTSTDDSLSNTDTIQPQNQQQLVDIKHDQFDEEECECEECVYGGIDVKEEEDDDDDSDGVQWIDDDQEDGESLRSLKRPKIDSTQLNNLLNEVDRQSTRQSTDEAQANEYERPEEDDQMESFENQFRDTQSTTEHYDHDQYNLYNDMIIQQDQNDTNNAIEDQVVDESITNPTQPNLAKSNRRFQCLQCSKSFHDRSKFQIHVRVHTGERPFACDLCDKRFSQSGTLTQHKWIHQNKKQFKCDHCGKLFTLKCERDSHLRTHTGERPYKCTFCDKSFTQLGHRKKHELAKHLHVNLYNGKPYRCKVCGHTATMRANVITHVRMVHFGLPHTTKEQRERNIVDERDPGELVEKVL